MAIRISLLVLVAFFTSLFYWAFRNLPAERWQIIAAVPFKRRDDGTAPSVSPSVVDGLRAVVNTLVLLFLELLWVLIFIYMGRSSVTAARILFHVVRERI